MWVTLVGWVAHDGVDERDLREHVWVGDGEHGVSGGGEAERPRAENLPQHQAEVARGDAARRVQPVNTPAPTSTSPTIRKH